VRSDEDDAIGVVFRYMDADNWYRFSMDRQLGYRRLVRCVEGLVDELWSDAQLYEVGRDHLVTIDAVGDSLIGWVDGVEAFAVTDPSHARGTIGLYCWGNTGARFSSVTVTGAAWSLHHRFADERPIEAGTQVHLHSGAEVDLGVVPAPGIVHRFAATSPDHGHRRLATRRGVDIRLRDGIGGLGHQRRFMPAAAYTSVGGLKLLRKADGTEAFLFEAAAGTPGATLSAGQYRLQFTYRRDNTAAVPGSQILSRAGDRSDERVTLEVPWVMP